MTTILEDQAMEFVNLDMAGPAEGHSFEILPDPMPLGEYNHDFDLALENVEGDDFSFWALQHFENSNPTATAIDTTDPTVEPSALQDMGTDAGPGDYESPKAFGDRDLEIQIVPCERCATRGTICKKIREGKYKDYCTCCVALRYRCSLAAASTSLGAVDGSFPNNPWPTLGDHPNLIPQEDGHHEQAQSQSQGMSTTLTNSSGLVSPTGVDGVGAGAKLTGTGPKIGARFSRESVKILKNWLSTHSKHPYPNEEEKEMLQKQTGLNKTQITNWLANARRRGKIAAPRSTSPGVRAWSNPIDIPQRRGTPASFENLNPLQRWQVSPPEHEPASVTDIARAVSSTTLSSGLNSPHSRSFTDEGSGRFDDGSGRSLCNASSASSVNTSHSSGGSFASAYSERGSFVSFGSSLPRGRRRRRRKAAPASPTTGKTSLHAPLKAYMCTFCTETFRTKHDWQRHEKSLHLSLERWVCCPDGPRTFNPENGQVSCVFCGHAAPDEAHLESHNHSACQERTLEDRTFYRKDHLRQHLKLMHDVKFVPAMEPWKVSTPEIRSRCGFCGIVMDTWTIRVDHLAEHFKTGNTMADWKGDWGFEAPVLQMVENGMPPYLIHHERNTPLPYKASQPSPESPRNAYELLKSELEHFRFMHWEKTGRTPTDDELQVEACRIIFAAEVLSKRGLSAVPCWLRDLLVSESHLAQQARMAPIKSPVDSRQAKLQINGKDNIFEDNAMERELHDYVKARSLLGLTAMDAELQAEACNILARAEESSARPSDDVANFLLRLIHRSTGWLAAFCRRALLPRSEDMPDAAQRSRDPATIDSTIHNYSRLETELAEYVRARRADLGGAEPTDADLQQKARIIIYEFDDGWNQTAADNPDWLAAFRSRHVSAEASAAALASGKPLTIASVTPGGRPTPGMGALASGYNALGGVGWGNAVGQGQNALNMTGVDKSINMILKENGLSQQPSSASGRSGPGEQVVSQQQSCTSGEPCTRDPVRVGAFFLNDANCIRRLARELSRWVKSTMSPNNPSSHVPTDEEIQHQARWIMYDSDDTWNQTAADNAEWLRRFKREVGILTDPSLPGLPEGASWNLHQGGTGFAPPYVFPPGDTTQTALEIAKRGNDGTGAPPMWQTEPATANQYLARLDPPPAAVFCAREVEHGLVAFARDRHRAGAGFPTDNEFRGRAREILGTGVTAADDPVLLDKFKGLMRERLGLAPEAVPAVDVSGAAMGEESLLAGFRLGAAQQQDVAFAAQVPGPVTIDGMDFSAMTDVDLSDIILQDMEFDFGEVDAAVGAIDPGQFSA